MFINELGRRFGAALFTADGIGNLFDEGEVSAGLNWISVSYRLYTAAPCDTAPTLRVRKSTNKRKSKGYSECRDGPHNLKVVGSNPTPATKIPRVSKRL